MDMEFSHSRHAPYLACVDQAGNIWIYVIIDDGEKINVKKLLQINREIPDLIDVDNDPWKINWCAYIPDEDTSRAIVRPARDSYSLLCVSHGDTVIKIKKFCFEIKMEKHSNKNYSNHIFFPSDGSLLHKSCAESNRAQRSNRL